MILYFLGNTNISRLIVTTRRRSSTKNARFFTMFFEIENRILWSNFLPRTFPGESFFNLDLNL